ncbi:HipA family kinase [Xenorhabdus bovienii]|uniref:HipA family kinase n=1 Tax=Xenorhabdus bovienii TaxID=40576 RepID=UPI003DA2D451
MSADDELHVIELVRKMDEGSTQPFLCRCNDDQLYVVKSTASMPRIELIHEITASILAQSIDLPIPDFKIVYVSDDFVEYLPTLYKGGISSGYAYASKFIEDSATINFGLAHEAIDIQKQKLIYLFDRLVNNSDRNLSKQGGNVNIIYNYKKQRYYLIDHNLAFDSECTLSQFDYHVFSPRHRDWVFDMLDCENVVDIVSTLKKKLTESISSLPSDWANELPDKDAALNNITSLIDRGFNQEFRSTIV